MTVAESRVVNELLDSNVLFRHLSTPPAFPTNASIYERYVRLDHEPFNNALYRTLDKARRQESKIISGFEKLREFNQNLGVDNSQAVAALSDLANECGFSHVLLRKTVLLQSSIPQDDPIQLILQKALEDYQIAKTGTVFLSLADTFGETYDLYSVFRNLKSIPDEGRENQFTRDLCSFVVKPFVRNEKNFLSTLQSFEQVSLIDACFYLCLNIYNTPWLRDAIGGNLASEVDAVFQKTWTRLKEQSIQLPFWKQAKSTQLDHRLHRFSSALIENAEISNWRRIVDTFYNDEAGRLARVEADLSKKIRKYFAPVSQISDLCNWSKRECLDLSTYSSHSSGVLTRSVGFSYLLEKRNGHLEVSEQEFMKLMSVTRDIIHLPDDINLNTLSQSTSSSLIKFIVLCMTYHRSASERSIFGLRRLLQEIVIDSHNGDLIEFLDFLHESSPNLAYYVYDFTDEAFLSQLFRLYSTTDEFFEARASLHEWYAQKTGDGIHAERAKTLRLDLKLQKIRGEIDDTRIFVDPARYIEWLQDNLLTDISGALRSRSGFSLAALLTDEKPDLPNQVSPEQQILRIMSRAFSEFITNQHFGIASYLGRRIRHGTLKGTLTGPVDKLLSEVRFRPLFRNDQFAKATSVWRENFDNRIVELTSEFLQIKSSRKPYGLFRTDINSQGRGSILAAAVKDIFSERTDVDGIHAVLGKIISYNWRLIDADLREVRSYILSCKNSWGTPNLQEFRRSASYWERELVQDFERDIAALLDEKFRTITNWFNQPKNLSPSASLRQLFEAVLLEARENFPQFDPNVTTNGSEDIVISGGAYHLIYDALHILVLNAARHGKATGILNYDFEILQEQFQKKMLSVTISSQIQSTDSDEAARKRMNEVLVLGPQDANVIEGKSGLRKLLSMQSEAKEVNDLSVKVTAGFVKVNFLYELAY